FQCRPQPFDLGIAVSDERLHVIDRADELAGVHPAERARPGVIGKLRWAGRGGGSARKQEGILRGPGFNVWAGPNAVADVIEGPVTARLESRGPVVGPLFVQMVRSALAWNGCGKEDDGCEAGQQPDECVGGGVRKMLRDLERHGEIESSLDR